MSKKRTSRRDFLRLAATSTVAAGVGPALMGARHAEVLQPRPAPPAAVAPNDRINLATIGLGIIGFIDTETALQVPGVQLVAGCDLYDARLGRARELFGSDLFTTRDYREVLARPDVDAVLIATPDHWHTRLAVEAMEAGKDVYLEKPMVQQLPEGPQVIDAQRRTGRVLQVGSQFASSILYDKVQELYESGAIGQVNLVEASYNRNSSIGAWQYSIPPDVTEADLDWDRFLGDAPRRPFDPVRFFRWRNYWDYGTGVAGDLYVHLFTGIHKALSAIGPTSVMATGGLRFWKDGRDVPDVILGLFAYPETAHHAPFTLSLQSNFVDGSGGGSVFRFIGDEGVMTIDWGSVKVERAPRRAPALNDLVEGYNSVQTWDEETRQAFIEAYQAEYQGPPVAPSMNETREYRVPSGYDDRYDHFTYFFESIREGRPVYEDPVFGYRAAAPALMSNLSYREQKIYRWDPEQMRVLT